MDFSSLPCVGFDLLALLAGLVFSFVAQSLTSFPRWMAED